jgi:predicted permease
MLQDLRHAARMLLQTKGWTAVVLLSLALGIGANTALFSGVNGLLLRNVQVPEPDRLVRIRWAGKNDMMRSSSGYGTNGKNASGEDIRETISYPIYKALVASNQTVTGLAASAPANGANVIYEGKAEIANGFLVSGNYFEVLNIRPMYGRLLTPDDDKDGAPPVAVISHGYWKKRFGGTPATIGKTVTMGKLVFTIVGVTPPEFTGVQNLTNPAPDLTVPLALDREISGTRLQEGTTWWLQTIGRLKPGVTAQQVRGNLEGPFQGAAREGWATYYAGITEKDRTLSGNMNRTAVPHLEVDSAARGVYEVSVNTRQSAMTLSIVVGLMLVIVCANVANLLLSRAAARQKEIAVRLSMGATRFRLMRQLLTESLLLAFIGGGLGLLVGYWSRQLLPFASEAPLDWHVFAFVSLLCLTVGIAFGFFPALRATRTDLSATMKENSRSVIRSRTLLGKALLVVQVAISVLVLIGAGLFLRTLQNLRNVDVGFNTRNLIIFGVQPRLNGYDPVRVDSVYDRLHDELKGITGVESVSHSANAFLAGGISTTGMHIQGKPANFTRGLSLYVMTVSPEFFDTLQIRIIRGRNLDIRDAMPKAPPVVLVNQTVAKKYFPGQDPIGKKFGYSPETTGEVEIVGIVGDVKYNSVRDEAPPTGFRPFPREAPANGRASIQVRVAGNPSVMQNAIRQAVQRVDPNLPLANMTTQSELVEGRFTQERFFAVAYSLFGALGLLLASIGLFGLMSYNVARRTNEIGIRMALGAQSREVLRMVLSESMYMVVVGIIIGIGAAISAGTLVSTVLFGLQPTDSITIVAAVATMLVVSSFAAYLPARRAARVDPMIALHYD